MIGSDDFDRDRYAFGTGTNRLVELGYPDTRCVLANIIGSDAWNGGFGVPYIGFGLMPEGSTLLSRFDDYEHMGNHILRLRNQSIGLVTTFDDALIDTMYRVGSRAGESFFKLVVQRRVAIDPIGLMGWAFIHIKIMEYYRGGNINLTAYATGVYCEYETDAILLGNYLIHAGVDA